VTEHFDQFWEAVMGNCVPSQNADDLAARVEKLELMLLADRSRQSGGSGQSPSVRHNITTGPDPEKKPILWKQGKNEFLHPLMYKALGIPRGLPLDGAVSKTWSSVPEPAICTVIWDGGGTDEFFRLQDQSVTIFKYTNPNTGTTTCTASYSATLVASGKARINTAVDYPFGYFIMALKNAAGAVLVELPHDDFVYNVNCNDNRSFLYQKDVDPGLYDLIEGFHWWVDGSFRVFRC
jgi:hypothetical protein